MICVAIAGNGITCPVCGSNDTSMTDEDGDSDGKWEEMQCEECTSTWTNLWKFNGQTDIDDNREVK